MAGLSAGEVFVTLSVKSGAVKPALQKATAQLRGFGKSLTALSVATGTLIADGLKFAFSKIGDIAKFAFDAAKLDPRTQAETNRFAKASDALWASLSKVGASLMSLVLPALTQLTQFLTFVVDSVNVAITYFESFGAVAALQTGDISTAVDIMWKEIQILFLQGSQLLLSMWDSMTGGFISAWQSMSSVLLSILSKVFTQAGNTVAGFMTGLSIVSPAIAAQLEPLKQLGAALQTAGNVSQMASTAASTAQAQEAEKRRQQAEEAQKILQQEIDALRSQVNQQSEQAVKQRDVQRAIDQAAFVGSTAKNVGSTSAFALSVEGGRSNTVFQTQKDLLKEAKEQKQIAKENLKQLEIIAKGGMVFG